MNLYLTIITTALVVTQIIRLIQNNIQLRRQRKEIDKTLAWFKDNDVSQRDFEVQRECFYLLRNKLSREEQEKKGDKSTWQKGYDCGHEDGYKCGYAERMEEETAHRDESGDVIMW